MSPSGYERVDNFLWRKLDDERRQRVTPSGKLFFTVYTNRTSGKLIGTNLNIGLCLIERVLSLLIPQIFDTYDYLAQGYDCRRWCWSVKIDSWSNHFAHRPNSSCSMHRWFLHCRRQNYRWITNSVAYPKVNIEGPTCRRLGSLT